VSCPYFAHSAFTELLEEPVAAEEGAGCDGRPASWDFLSAGFHAMAAMGKPKLAHEGDCPQHWVSSLRQSRDKDAEITLECA
jgi:hypothetical protein